MATTFAMCSGIVRVAGHNIAIGVLTTVIKYLTVLLECTDLFKYGWAWAPIGDANGCENIF